MLVLFSISACSLTGRSEIISLRNLELFQMEFSVVSDVDFDFGEDRTLFEVCWWAFCFFVFTSVEDVLFEPSILRAR